MEEKDLEMPPFPEEGLIRNALEKIISTADNPEMLEIVTEQRNMRKIVRNTKLLGIINIPKPVLSVELINDGNTLFWVVFDEALVPIASSMLTQYAEEVKISQREYIYPS